MSPTNPFERFTEEKFHDLLLDLVDDVFRGNYTKFLRNHEFDPGNQQLIFTD